MKKTFFALFPLILTACSSSPTSYLPSGTTPILNIEANISQHINVTPKAARFSIENRSDMPLNVVYKLFWYNIHGVTQSSDPTWQPLHFEAGQTHTVSLIKPTAESVNYRLYLRSRR